MRIIIESDEKSTITTPTSSSEPSPPAVIETLDAGPPSEALMGAMTDPSASLMEGEGLSGGPPPEWLIEAIRGAAQLSAESVEISPGDTDAGSAPNGEA